MELLVGEGTGGTVGKGDQTLINVHLHILSEEVIRSPIGCSGIAGNLDVGIEVEDTYRKLCKYGSTLIVVGSGASDGDCCRIGLIVNRILSREAFCQLHVIELPVVDAVQVDNSLDRLNRLDLVCNEVHPIN